MKKFIFIFLLLNSLVNNMAIKLNNNIIGSIYIKNTSINYPIVKGTDNSYYLNHNYLGQEDKFGSIFLDYRNNITDRKLLIYGHNSNYYNHAPFKELEKYVQKAFLANNQKILITILNHKYTYIVFSVMIVRGGDNRYTELHFKKNSYAAHLQYLKTSSIYDTGIAISKNDYIITLQTCNYNPANSYLLINAKRENNEKNNL